MNEPVEPEWERLDLSTWGDRTQWPPAWHINSQVAIIKVSFALDIRAQPVNGSDGWEVYLFGRLAFSGSQSETVTYLTGVVAGCHALTLRQTITKFPFLPSA